MFGEIGLAGEVRPAPRGQDRLKEAAKLGFEKAIIPKANLPKGKIAGIEVIAVERVDQAVQALCDIAHAAVAQFLSGLDDGGRETRRGADLARRFSRAVS